MIMKHERWEEEKHWEVVLGVEVDRKFGTYIIAHDGQPDL